MCDFFGRFLGRRCCVFLHALGARRYAFRTKRCRNTTQRVGFDASKEPMKKLFDKYKLDKEVQDFVGHSLALHQDDDYLERHAKETMDRISLYVESLARYVVVALQHDNLRFFNRVCK